MRLFVECLWWGGWLTLLLAFLLQQYQKAGRNVDNALGLMADPYNAWPDDARTWGAHRHNPPRS